jgi:hypothetical protein
MPMSRAYSSVCVHLISLDGFRIPSHGLKIALCASLCNSRCCVIVGAVLF